MFNTSYSRDIGDIIGGLQFVDYNASLIETGGNFIMRNSTHYKSGHTDSLSKYLHDTYGNAYSLWMMMSYATSDKIILQVAYSWSDMAIMCMRKKFWWSSYSWSDWQAVTPINHAVNDTKYGLGTGSVYGHVKVSDNYTSSAGNASSGIAASSQAVYNTYNTISNLKNGSNKFSTIKLTNDAYMTISGNTAKPGHLRLLTGETNATSQAEFVFEQDGKLSSRYRTRSSISASWGAWGSWHYIGDY